MGTDVSNSREQAGPLPENNGDVASPSTARGWFRTKPSLAVGDVVRMPDGSMATVTGAQAPSTAAPYPRLYTFAQACELLTQDSRLELYRYNPNGSPRALFFAGGPEDHVKVVGGLKAGISQEDIRETWAVKPECPHKIGSPQWAAWMLLRGEKIASKSAGVTVHADTVLNGVDVLRLLLANDWTLAPSSR